MNTLASVLTGLVSKLTALPVDPGDALARAAGLPPVLGRLLAARGVTSAAEAERFLHPDESELHDPLRMRGIGEASEMLLSAARGGRRVVVFGDYDVDGVTAVAQLKAALSRVGGSPVSFLPHRLKDGYGLRPETVARVARELSPSVIVTVDCGITAIEGVAFAREQGIDVIVTDHHLVPDELPAGAVVVNPRQPGCSYPYKELSGAGIAFKLSEAIARRAGVSLSRDALLRAACLGTIADIVPLTGENRAIAALGLAALARPRAPGLVALLEACGVPAGEAPTAEQVAFRIAPRLNAAGRLDTADLALAIFEERNPARGAEIARELCARNAERQSIERRVFAEARDRVSKDFVPDRDALIVEADPAWHRGVLGIAAARLAREYNRPVLLFALEGEKASGSGRSIPGVSLHGTLKEISHLFTEFGGHDQAVGGTLPAAGFAAFREEARALFARRLPRERFVRREAFDAELRLEDVSPELLSHLEKLEPHGAGNPRPVFSCANVRAAEAFRPLGEAGWRGRLWAAPGPIDAIRWNDSGNGSAELPVDSPFRMLYRISRSGWTGRPEVEIVRTWPTEPAQSGATPVLAPAELAVAT